MILKTGRRPLPKLIGKLKDTTIIHNRNRHINIHKTTFNPLRMGLY